MTDFDDLASGGLEQDGPSRMARGEPMGSAEEFVRGQRLGTAEGTIRDHLDSPSMRIARDLRDGPAARLTRDLATSPDVPFATGVGVLADQVTAMLKAASDQKPSVPPCLVERSATIPPFVVGLDVHTEFDAAVRNGIDPNILEGIHGVLPLPIDPGLADAASRAQRRLEDTMRPFDGLAGAFEGLDRQHRDARKAMLTILAGPFGDVARKGQWASVLGAVQPPDAERIFSERIGAAIAAIQASTIGAFGRGTALDQTATRAMLGLNARIENDFIATHLKMSVIAGIGETFSLREDLLIDAYRSLFGDWRTRPELPEDYWRDGRVRERMYREAEVDDGLIVATPGMALEVMIESGLTTGMRSETNAVAIITLGEVSMTVRSRGTRKDAYSILERFEIELRAYVTRKLGERFGDDWFKLRASNLVGKAKAVRKAAMERGEAFAPLVDFIEMGELAGLVLATRNWDEIFGEVFINRAEFDHDMQKLIAGRRPTMHVRTIDGVRLVEMVCVVQRLSQHMADDGAWRRQAELDH